MHNKERRLFNGGELTYEKLENMNPEAVARKKRQMRRKLAHKSVRNSVRSGKLRKPRTCAFCDNTKIEAHHLDETYANKLDVIWLCKAHHDVFTSRKESIANVTSESTTRNF